jgi:hypothetical protein
MSSLWRERSAAGPLSNGNVVVNSSVDWSTHSKGGDVIGEAMRQAPAQAELRPTSAGAFGVTLSCDVTPMNSSRLVDPRHVARQRGR